MEREIVIRLRFPQRPRLRWLVGIGAAILGGAALAYAAVPNTFASGDVLKASDMNANFAALESEISALQSAETADQTAIADLQTARTSDESTLSAVQSSQATDEATLATHSTAIAQLQTFVSLIKNKGGNNGTASCDVFCAGANWGGWTGTCVGAFNSETGQFIDCSTAPGLLSAQLTCYCSQFNF